MTSDTIDNWTKVSGGKPMAENREYLICPAERVILDLGKLKFVPIGDLDREEHDEFADNHITKHPAAFYHSSFSLYLIHKFMSRYAHRGVVLLVDELFMDKLDALYDNKIHESWRLLPWREYKPEPSDHYRETPEKIFELAESIKEVRLKEAKKKAMEHNKDKTENIDVKPSDTSVII